MKKYLAIGLILCASLMSGCSKEKVTIVSNDTTISTESLDENFVYLQDGSVDIVYDARTEIVYYKNDTYSFFYAITPFYGKDKQLVTKDEFIKNYMK